MRLYIANINFNATDTDLKQHFSSIGEVKDCKIIHDRESGKSKGFGFLEYQDPQHAQEAMQTMNQQPFMNRNLTIKEANQRG